MRILLADDHDLVRDTLSAYLQNEGAAEVDCASSLDEALCKVEQGPCFDIVLLDYNMPGMQGLEGLSRALEQIKCAPVALISGNAPQSVAQAAIEQGASGFLPKTMTAKGLVKAVRAMQAGHVFFPASHFQNRAEQNPFTKLLSKRELEVLHGLCKGQSNKEIARDLELQEVTIKLHVRTLCRKLEAKNRTHAAMLAKEAGLF